MKQFSYFYSIEKRVLHHYTITPLHHYTIPHVPEKADTDKLQELRPVGSGIFTTDKLFYG